MLGCLLSAPALAPAAEPTRTVVSLPDSSWGIGMDLSGHGISIDDVKPDGRRYLMSSHPTTGLNVSVTLERVPNQAVASGCVNHLEQLSKSPIAQSGRDLRLTTTSTLPSLEYTVLEFRGVKLEQRHVHLCYPKDNVYVDLHLSKIGYTPTDEPLFRNFLQTLKIEPAQAPAPQPRATPAAHAGSALDLFKAGSEFYLQGNYQQAIGLYQQALDLEKTNPQLDRIMWRVLVDNLGMAYGISGKLSQAREIFEYGIQEEHTYPMFHYNLACTFAEMNDREQAMKSLRTAFQHRKHHNPGEPGIPDPRRDVSFRRFMAQDDFRKFVDQLMAHSS